MINLAKWENWKESTRLWMSEKARSLYAKWWLAGISFAESAFFILPVEPFLMAVLLAVPQSWLFYSIWTAGASVLGGILGYLIGWGAFDLIGQPLIQLYGLEAELEMAREMFSDNAFLAVLIAAFTPIPYKVFTIGAGFFYINFLAFISASIIGRLTRFLILGLVMKLFGQAMGRLFYRYFNYLTFIFGLIILILIFYFYLA